MSVQVLTRAPGGYVAIEFAEIVNADHWRKTDDVRLRFRNGDFVIVSREVAQELSRFGTMARGRREAE